MIPTLCVVLILWAIVADAGTLGVKPIVGGFEAMKSGGKQEISFRSTFQTHLRKEIQPLNSASSTVSVTVPPSATSDFALGNWFCDLQTR
jgi:hypothetical protein